MSNGAPVSPPEASRHVTMRRSVSIDLGHIAWVARDVLMHFKRAALAAMALNLVGTAAGAAAIGALVLYARYLESGAPIHFAGMTIELSRTTGGVIGFSAVMVLLGLCSAACLYTMQWLVGWVTIRYLRMCVQRLVNVAADPAYAGWGAVAGGRPHRVLYELTGRSARVAAMIMRRMLLVMLPLIVFSIAATCLVIVSPLLTALLVPLMLAYLIPLYRVMRGVTTHQAQFLEANREARGGLRDTIKWLTGPSLSVHRKLELASQSLQTPERDLTDDLFSRRRLADDRVHLLNTTFFILCVQVLFVFFAIEAGRNGHQWSELLLYIVALRFAVMELRRVTSTLVIVSRLLPLFVPYREFVRAAEELKRANEQRTAQPTPLPDQITIRCDGEPMWNSASSLEIRRGSIVWVLQSWRPSHSDLEAVVMQLEKASAMPLNMLSRAGIFAGADDDDGSAEAVAQLAAPNPAIEEGWSRLGVAEELHEALNGSAGRKRTESLRQLSPEARLALAAAPLLGPCEVRVVSALELKGIDEHFVEQLVNDSTASFTVLVAKNPRLALDPAYKRVREKVAGAVVMRDGCVVACGDLDWLKMYLNPIRAALTTRPTDDDDEVEVDDGDEDDMEF